MKNHSLLTLGTTGLALAVFAAGCFQGPSDKIPGDHSNDDVPVVTLFCDEDDDADDVRPCEALPNPGPLASGEFTLTFGVFDADSEFVSIWEECPYPDQEGAAPILKIGWSPNGGNSFQPIVPAHLKINGEVLEVPTCAEVAGFDEPLLGAATTSTGMLHTLTWNTLALDPLNPLLVDNDGNPTTPPVQALDTAGNPVYLPYILASTDVTLRISVDDNSFTSDPGDSAEFTVANVPSFTPDRNGARPGDTLLGVVLDGVLTLWDGTTVLGSADNLVVSNLVVSSNNRATVDITMGPDTDQIPREFELVTPGVGLPSGDEIAKGVLWTCAEVGSAVEEYETALLGGGAQPICNWPLNWGATGSLTNADNDFFEFVADSSGNASFSLDWDSPDSGTVTDYDAYIFNLDTGLAACADDLLACACATVNKPEVGTVTGLVAGQTYILYISHYAGQETTYTVTIGSGP